MFYFSDNIAAVYTAYVSALENTIMKKTLFILAAAAAVMSLGSCAKTQQTTTTTTDTQEDRKEVYAGVLPAADAEGIRYTLCLDYDADNNYTDGDYDLEETYLVSDTTATDGVGDGQTFKSDGNFTVGTSADGKKFLKLVPENDTTDGSTLYFLVDSDNSITLVSETLEPSVNPDLNYTLTRTK